MRGISIRVDQLTHSIEDAKTGQSYQTEALRIFPEQINEIKKSHWLFDWKSEVLLPGREVYKLVCIDSPKQIQGLMSIEIYTTHLALHLIESAKINRGKFKQYLGVPANLFAYACKASNDNGFNGLVAFISKTLLVKHYQEHLGATHVGGNRMFIGEEVAKKLINQYFSS